MGGNARAHDHGIRENKRLPQALEKQVKDAFKPKK